MIPVTRSHRPGRLLGEMILEETIRARLGETLDETNFVGLGALYRGKVRDVYRHDDRLIIVTTDRVSAFDHVLGTIPFKGEILNAIAVDGFLKTSDIVPNHLLVSPDPNVMVVKAATAFPVEFVVRAYMTGSLWRDYQSNKARAYGIDFPPNLRKDELLVRPILTPSTKATLGAHDEPISLVDIVRRGLMNADALDDAVTVALKLFERGQSVAAERGLILVDTKYEFGRDASGQLMVIDEIHTPDSSRYWIAKDYDERFSAGQPQHMLDKENLRQWLIEKHHFSGHGTPPMLDDEIRIRVARFYIELFERLLMREFVGSTGDARMRILSNLKAANFMHA